MVDSEVASSGEADVRFLFTGKEWETFERHLRCWLGDASHSEVLTGELLVEETIVAATPRTWAATVKQWLCRLGLADWAGRIELSKFSDAPGELKGSRIPAVEMRRWLKMSTEDPAIIDLAAERERRRSTSEDSERAAPKGVEDVLDSGDQQLTLPLAALSDGGEV